MKGKTIILFILVICVLQSAISQTAYPDYFKILTVANGLPQSYISGLVQDSIGFIWVATRDGLARYDGKKFKVFRHIPGDTSTLTNSTITHLYLDRQNRLWIIYETGDIDVLNAGTENLIHFSKLGLYKAVYGMVKLGSSITEDANDNIWILSKTSGLFKCNIDKNFFHFYSEAALHFTNNKIIGFTAFKENILLTTDTALVLINQEGKVLQSVAYTFSNPHLYDTAMPWKNTNTFIRNNEVIILDNNRLIIYNFLSKVFNIIPVPDIRMVVSSIAENKTGDAYITYGSNIYFLSASDELTIWMKYNAKKSHGYPSILIDNSGVLWLGGNATGIELRDLRLPRLSARLYKKRFQVDILEDYLHVPDKEIANTILLKMGAYQFRWVKDESGNMWICKASDDFVKQPDILHYSNGHLSDKRWHYSDTFYKNHAQINAVTFSGLGKLWGIDYYMHPVYLDTSTYTIKVYPAIDSVDFSVSYTANSVLMDGEDKFWISTSLNGLYFYNISTHKKLHFTYSEEKDALPTNQLMNLVQDRFNHDILWIGTLGGGLIRFSKSTGTCTSYTEKNGLPNNTVYAVVADARGILWCSSNKGIFSFDPQKKLVLQSFTSKDGLIDDEFNRYHFLKLPDGKIAFGAVNGYTVFDPLTFANDNFQPSIVLTAIRINNTPADFGDVASPFKQAINSMQKIELPYNKNFLFFEFAALEYNIPEKLQYRYMLDGFDKNWVYSGNDNVAVYTKLPPGKYTLKINATNTAGEWSSATKTLAVIINPPFWQTWWFITLMLAAAAAAVYFFLRSRITAIKKKERQKIKFEQEASELKAQALRAQMNPHFIFNCLNSIKALIQEDKKQEAVIYLTTFSKLIRSQLNNVQTQVSLEEELNTCKFYTQLESLRFGKQIRCEFKISNNIDASSLKVPPLILQPFIENAIWHGIVPKQGGKVIISVKRDNNVIICIIQDDGIGREMAMRNKSQTNATYESKGMSIVKNRLNLYNALDLNEGSVEIYDQSDKYGNATGTTVIVKFKH